MSKRAIEFENLRMVYLMPKIRMLTASKKSIKGDHKVNSEKRKCLLNNLTIIEYWSPDILKFPNKGLDFKCKTDMNL